jgi:hypothetical protein
LWEDGKQLTRAHCIDGSSNVLLLVESHTAGVVWTEPRDLDLTSPVAAGGKAPASDVSSAHPGIVVAGLADGSVRTISSKVDPAVLKQLAHRRDGLPAAGWDE